MTPSFAHSVVIGGGILGLSIARELALREPGCRVTLVEKEQQLATHQTGRNSGVIHSGLYYAPGSEKARLCLRGRRMLESYCETNGIAWENCGKVVVATTRREQARLVELAERGRAKGIELSIIGSERLRELEPHVTGVAALHVPGAGIVNYREVCQQLSEDLRNLGGEVCLGARVRRVTYAREGVRVELHGRETMEASRVVNCAGLHSDRIARGSGVSPGARIIPFRGEYFVLSDTATHLCQNLVYPVPDPRLPFLGVHFTRMVGGGVECGPNAVLALAREGYRWRDVNLRDLWDTGTWPGTWRLFTKHWRTGCGEVWRSISKAAFVQELQRLIPAIRAEDLESAPAGVRAQALGPDGSLVDDFLICREGAITHVINAPSPAATASLAIAEAVVDPLTRKL